MEFNEILLWISGVSALLILVQGIRYSARWTIGTSCLVLVVVVWGVQVFPATAGYAAGAVMTLTVLVPGIAFRRLGRALMSQRYDRARRILKILRFTYSPSIVRSYFGLVEGFECLARGDTEQAVRVFTTYADLRTPMGKTALAQLYMAQGKWAELCRWIETQGGAKTSDLSLLAYYLRALGESGNRLGLLKAMDICLPVLDAPAASSTKPFAFLMIFCFCGCVEQVEELFLGPLSAFPAELQSFWYATARYYSGAEAEARAALEKLVRSSNKQLQIGAQRRLDRLQGVVPLSDEEQRLLVRLTEIFYQQARYAESSSLGSSVPYMTYILVALNCAAFGLEIVSGGSEDGPTLYRLGALYAPAVSGAGEWWRLGASLFLHFGFSHLLLNMVAVALLAPFIEREFGAVRFLLFYLWTGLLSMVSIVLLADWGITAQSVTVGASGAIMGIVGGTAAVLLLAWRKNRYSFIRRRLESILFIVLLQVFFDLTQKGLSFSGHISGLILGLISAPLFRPRDAERGEG